MKKLTTVRAVECPYRENLTSIYRCSSCQFQAGGIATGLACGRDEVRATMLKCDRHGRIYCPIRRRNLKKENCVNCFYRESLQPGHVDCMAGKVYIMGRKDQ